MEPHLAVVFVTGASGAGKNHLYGQLTKTIGSGVEEVSVDILLKKIGPLVGEDWFKHDVYSYDKWRTFLLSRSSFQQALEHVLAELPKDKQSTRCFVHGNHFLLHRIEELVLTAVLSNPAWKHRDIRIAKFLLDIDPVVLFRHLQKRGDAKLMEEVAYDVERFRKQMPDRGYEPHRQDTIQEAILTFLRAS